MNRAERESVELIPPDPRKRLSFVLCESCVKTAGPIDEQWLLKSAIGICGGDAPSLIEEIEETGAYCYGDFYCWNYSLPLRKENVLALLVLGYSITAEHLGSDVEMLPSEAEINERKTRLKYVSELHQQQYENDLQMFQNRRKKRWWQRHS